MAKMRKEDIETFGDAVRYIRWYMRMTQKEFAEELGFSEPAISLWERDRAMPSLANYKALTHFIKRNNIDIELPE